MSYNIYIEIKSIYNYNALMIINEEECRVFSKN